MADFTEQRFDYSAGRSDAPELTIMVGVSGSGKSVVSKAWVNRGRGDIVRLNRDSLRAMLYCDVPWNGRLENLTRNLQQEAARMALQSGKDVIIDDTNCVRQVRYKWEIFAREMRVKFRVVTMTVPLKECIKRDLERQGKCPNCAAPITLMADEGKREGTCTECRNPVTVSKECVGEAIIRKQHKNLTAMAAQEPEKREAVKLTRPYFERQQLKEGGFAPRLNGCPWVLVDIDGTLANHVGVRGPFEEHRVLEDAPWPTVIAEVNRLAETHNVCIISGRHDFCGDDTCDWLEMHGVRYDHILMRYSGDNRSDAIVKAEILNELAAVIGKENIACVIDDRPRVVDMWHQNGVAVRQVFGGEFLENPTVQHKAECPYEKEKGYRRCPECGALEYF